MEENKEIEAKKEVGVITKALDFAYEKALNGLPGFETAVEMAEDYIKKNENKIECVNSLIRYQIAKTSTSGFLTGVGGMITMPVAIPANLASVMYVQIRMIAAIAHMGGYDLKDDRVKTLVYCCLVGTPGVDIFKEAAKVTGVKTVNSAIGKISGKTLTAINQKIGFRFITKAGSKGVVNLGKLVPLIGGIVGGAVDGVSTNTIGNIARKTFIEDKINLTSND